jgi:hypothetical protein
LGVGLEIGCGNWKCLKEDGLHFGSWDWGCDVHVCVGAKTDVGCFSLFVRTISSKLANII